MIDERYIATREMMVGYLSRELINSLTKVNGGFKVVRIEAPLVMKDDGKVVGTDLVNYAWSEVLKSKNSLPYLIWQFNKSLELHVDGIKEQNLLEFAIVYSKTTVTNYSGIAIDTIIRVMEHLCKTNVRIDSRGSGSDIGCDLWLDHQFVGNVHCLSSEVNTIVIKIDIDLCIRYI